MIQNTCSSTEIYIFSSLNFFFFFEILYVDCMSLSLFYWNEIKWNEKKSRSVKYIHIYIGMYRNMHIVYAKWWECGTKEKRGHTKEKYSVAEVKVHRVQLNCVDMCVVSARLLLSLCKYICACLHIHSYIWTYVCAEECAYVWFRLLSVNATCMKNYSTWLASACNTVAYTTTKSNKPYTLQRTCKIKGKYEYIMTFTLNNKISYNNNSKATWELLLRVDMKSKDKNFWK